ncbi:hypothetical protein Syun_029809 [Stephania yunnanensis]|uniref:Uncharacterized protein n=1 Tax=Stephania yunnanensis TaxID=152371 RepID=A0AAP0E640_9MAGN
MSRCARKGVDGGSHVAEHREKGLIIARGGTEGEASEFFEDLLGNEKREEVYFVKIMWVVLAVVEAIE